jgi:threonine efflux protein
MDAIYAYLPSILAAYAAYVIAVLSPGPAVFAIISTSMTQGRKAGLLMALGIYAGSATWASAAVLGLAAILHTYAVALEVLRVLGGLYLLYLAYKAFRAAAQAEVPAANLRRENYSANALLTRGYLLHLTNPKAIFGWLAIITLGMPAGAPASVAVVIVGGCLLLGITCFTGYAVLFSTGRAVTIYASMRRWIEGTMSAFYCLAGVKLLTSKI